MGFISMGFIFTFCKSNNYTGEKYSNSKVTIEYPAPLVQRGKSNQHTQCICDYPQKIIAEKQHFRKDTIFEYRINPSNCKCLLKYKQKYDINSVIAFMIDKLNVKSDTIIEDAYLLTSDSIINSDYKDNSMLTSMENLAMNARFLTHSPIVLGESYGNSFYIDNRILKIRNIDELRDFLYTHHHISLQPSDDVKCVKITYYMP